MNGFIGQAESGKKGCLDPTDPACTNSANPDVMGYHTQSDIPNYWTYAKDFVLQDHMFEPNASWSLPVAPVPRVGVVGVLHPARQPVELHERACQTHPRQARRRTRRVYGGRAGPTNGGNASTAGRARVGQPIYAWTDLTYLLHKRT